jgi:hypothetical protein
VQCLANPVYLNYLAQQKTFDKPEFVAYLGYLQYFKEPKYAKFLQYVTCLSHRLLTDHVTQSPWTDATCTRAAATGAFPPRHTCSWSYGQAGYRGPAECSANEEGLIQDCMFDASHDDQQSPSSIPALEHHVHVIACGINWKDSLDRSELASRWSLRHTRMRFCTSRHYHTIRAYVLVS